MNSAAEYYKDSYKLFGLNGEAGKDYQGAEKFSQSFKKCSVLKDSNVTYSAGTVKVSNKSC